MQADLRYARRSDNERSACYRSERLAGLEAMEAEMEVIVQVWVYSHGEGGGFALNEAADALADAARQGDFVEGVRVAVPHACAVLREVKRSHGAWMLDAMQVHVLEQLLQRSERTLRPSASTWREFVDDPVRTHALPSQACMELFTVCSPDKIGGETRSSRSDACWAS